MESDGFTDFVASRSAGLLRFGWLLTGDEHSAQDLVQTALVKTWARWARLARGDHPVAYTRRVMVSTWLSWRRRRWWSEIPTEHLPDGGGLPDEAAQADLRSCVASALAELPRGQRAVVVLRYFEHLSEVQTAAMIGCSVGTVKSQAARALARLRASTALGDLWDEEVSL